MILFNKDVKFENNKRIEEIAIGDILKRKTDNCFYRVQDICMYSSVENEAYLRYHFYGFSIKYKDSIKNHFVNTFGDFEIYSKKE